MQLFGGAATAADDDEGDDDDGEDWHRRDVSANPLRCSYALPSKEECAEQLLNSSKLLLLQLVRTEVDDDNDDDDNPSSLVEKEDTLHALDDISSPSIFVVQADVVIFFPAPKLKNEGRALLGDPRAEFSAVVDDDIHKLSLVELYGKKGAAALAGTGVLGDTTISKLNRWADEGKCGLSTYRTFHSIQQSDREQRRRE